MTRLFIQVMNLQIQVLLIQVALLREKLEKRMALFKVAKASLGIDVSPGDAVNDELGCAESVSWIIKKVFSDFPIITGTWTLNDRLSTDIRFEKVAEPEIGSIIISPTTGGPIRGHVGICGEGQDIMSSDSTDGLWKMNFIQQTWNSRYQVWGKLPVYFYRIKI